MFHCLTPTLLPPKTALPLTACTIRYNNTTQHSITEEEEKKRSAAMLLATLFIMGRVSLFYILFCCCNYYLYININCGHYCIMCSFFCCFNIVNILEYRMLKRTISIVVSFKKYTTTAALEELTLSSVTLYALC